MPPSAPLPILLGRYELSAEIASGGMASVHLGARVGAVGFARLVAIKRLHPHLAKNPEFVEMFLDEARLAARIRHPNVVATLDVVHEEGELFLVMDYLEGDSIAALVRGAKKLGEKMPVPVAVAIAAGALHGLQAAHEAKGLDGLPLGVVHRDVSPQNVLVGVDGVARLVDFGIAMANVRLHTTREGQIKGKLSYMAPEQLTRDERPSPASDLYAVGVVLWEMCAGARAFQASSEPALLGKVLSGQVPRLDRVAPWVPVALADVAHRAMRASPTERFESAREMALALEAAVAPAPAPEVGAFVERVVGEALAARRAQVVEIERALSTSAGGPRSASTPAARPAVSVTPPGSTPPVPARSDVDTATGHTVATPPSARLPEKRRGVWVGLGIAGVALAGAALGWSALRGAPHPEALAEPSVDAPAVAPALPLPASAIASAPIPASAAASAEVEAPVEKRAPAARPAPRGRGAEPVKRPVAKEGCDPPYYVDSAGIQRVKRACFGR